MFELVLVSSKDQIRLNSIKGSINCMYSNYFVDEIELNFFLIYV